MMFLAAAPISECRGAIIYGLSSGLDPFLVFGLSVLANIMMVPIIFWFLDKAHFRNLALKLFGKKMERIIEKNKRRFEKYEELALLLFVAVPLPVTGAYTGALIAHILDLNRKKAFAVIYFGVLIAAIIMFFGVSGGLFVLNS